MKLKTLNDMNFYDEINRKYIETKLKDEAIKWIKALKIDNSYPSQGTVCIIPLTPITETFTYNKEGTRLLYPKEAIDRWIKYFFNLTECTCTELIKGYFAHCPIHSITKIKDSDSKEE